MHRKFATRALEPRYGFPEVAHIVGKRTDTVRRWSVGHTRTYKGKPANDKPLIHCDGDDKLPLSFLNLLELRFLAGYREGTSLPAIRRALDFAAQSLGVERPLLEVDFKQRGRELFLEFAENDPYFVNASRGGQFAWPTEAEDLVESLDYDESERAAYRWWPLGKQTPVLLDTRVNAGRPSTAESGVRTIAIATRKKAGWKPADIAADVAASIDEVKAALQLEEVA
jgi:uncharacterized protein (DUF433 family)